MNNEKKEILMTIKSCIFDKNNNEHWEEKLKKKRGYNWLRVKSSLKYQFPPDAKVKPWSDCSIFRWVTVY